MSAFAAILGTSTVIRHVQHLVLKVAEIDTPVLISGEAGSGKELVGSPLIWKNNLYVLTSLVEFGFAYLFKK